MERLSAFSKPDWSSRDLVHKDPPLFHISAYVTGGLQDVFKRIHSGKPLKQTAKHKSSVKGDQFRPFDGFVLSRRYRLTDKLSTQGQFAVIVGAKDEFCQDRPVIIKVMHKSFYSIGLQERHCLWRLAMADPCNFSHTVHLLNSFTFDGHCCLVFEFLHPTPITSVFEEYNLPNSKLIKMIRKVAFQLLKVLGFLQQKNTIHADIKPENILLQDVHDVGSLKVIDFGNAIHHIHKEVSLYYHDFELQTLLYRAPEVMFGIPFGTEVDMWSLGCVLAELYLGESLFGGTTKDELLCNMTKLLGRFPVSVFRRGKFFENYQSLTSKMPQPDATICVMQRLRDSRNYAFANFLAELLRYNPDERLTPTQALCHSFLAPEFSLGYFIPSGNEHGVPSCIAINPKSYRLSPKIPAELKRQNPSTFDLLKMGTQSYDSEQILCNKIAKVCPFDPHASEVQCLQDTEQNYEPSQSHTASTSDHVTSETNVKYFTEGVVDQPCEGNVDTDHFDNTASSSAATQDNIKSENVHPYAEFKERKQTNLDANNYVNSAKLKNIMAMISVEQERIEDIMEVKQSQLKEKCHAGIRREPRKASGSCKLKNQNKKRMKMNSSNFLCEYASDSTESDLEIIERRDQEKDPFEMHDRFADSLSQVGIGDDRQISLSRTDLFKKSKKLDTVPVQFGEKNYSSETINYASENNQSKKALGVETNSRVSKPRVDHQNTCNEVIRSGDLCCHGSQEQNSNRTKFLSRSKPKRFAKRKLLFSKAFPTPINKVKSSKSLMRNEKYLNARKVRMEKSNKKAGLGMICSENSSSAQAVETFKVINDVDPFEFKVTPMKCSKTLGKVVANKEKKTKKSGKKICNTGSMGKNNNYNITINVQGKEVVENSMSKTTTLENLDTVFKKYNKMQDISPICASSTDSYPRMSESSTKKRCLFLETEKMFPVSGVELVYSSPCKRKCVETTVNLSESDFFYSPSMRRSRRKSTNFVVSDSKPEIYINEIIKCSSIIPQTKLLHMKSPSSTESKAMKTINGDTVCKVEESVHGKTMQDSFCSAKRASLAEIKSHSKDRGSHTTLQPVRSGVNEVKNTTDGQFPQDFAHTETKECQDKAQSTQCYKNTSLLNNDDDDIILLEI